MYRYAIIDDDSKFAGIAIQSVEATGSDYIETAVAESALIGKMWDGATWIVDPDYVAPEEIESTDLEQGSSANLADLEVTGDVTLHGDIKVPETGWLYIKGDADTDGSWRIGYDQGTAQAVLQIRESGQWTNKGAWA